MKRRVVILIALIILGLVVVIYYLSKTNFNTNINNNLETEAYTSNKIKKTDEIINNERFFIQ